MTQARKIDRQRIFEYEFSVCTLVTYMVEYAEMKSSFENAGFLADCCEYLYIDNSNQNVYDAYGGINRFLQEAKGRYIIICHQDILLKDRTIDELRSRIREIENVDNKWAILANAGGINLKYTAMHLVQGSGNVLFEKYLPLKTNTVDENFMLVKNEANLALSANLNGFHLYGTDICLIADILGYTCYVIDFSFVHKSDGNADEKFHRLKKQLISKYRKALRPRFVGTTITRFFISGNRIISTLGNTRLILFIARQFYKIFRGKKQYQKQVLEGKRN
jgi:hypothetical protein